MREETIIIITAMCCITALAITNYFINHVDGALLISVASLIAGLAGYKAKDTVKARSKTQAKETEKEEGDKNQ